MQAGTTPTGTPQRSTTTSTPSSALRRPRAEDELVRAFLACFESSVPSVSPQEERVNLQPDVTGCHQLLLPCCQYMPCTFAATWTFNGEAMQAISCHCSYHLKQSSAFQSTSQAHPKKGELMPLLNCTSEVTQWFLYIDVILCIGTIDLGSRV